MQLFHKDGDYEAFERALTEGFGRHPVDLRPAGLQFTLRGPGQARKTQDSQ